jgi:hypothetical protein
VKAPYEEVWFSAVTVSVKLSQLPCRHVRGKLFEIDTSDFLRRVLCLMMCFGFVTGLWQWARLAASSVTTTFGVRWELSHSRHSVCLCTIQCQFKRQGCTFRVAYSRVTCPTLREWIRRSPVITSRAFPLCWVSCDNYTDALKMWIILYEQRHDYHIEKWWNTGLECKIWSFYGRGYGECRILGCYAVWLF